MSSGKDLDDFPNVEAKLQKPAKQSAFEKQRAEAEAKRKREAAETAAVYEDFVKSFDRDDDGDGYGGGDGGRFGQGGGGGGFGRGRFQHGSGPPAGPGGPSKRHFGMSGLKSGPGSLGPAPTSFAKKRSFQDFNRGSRDRPAMQQSGPSGEEQDGGPLSMAKAFDASDDEDTKDTVDRAEEKATAKPTMRLWDLPPGVSTSMLKGIISEHIPVESVRLLPASVPGSSERKSAQAIAIFSKETPSGEVEAAVSSLKGRYLGYGYYLSLDRGPSTAVINSIMQQRHNFSNLSSSMPFDAKPVEQTPFERDAPSGYGGPNKGFAPPTSYAPPGAGGAVRGKIFHIPVKPPRDIRTVQIINKVIEGVLAQGPEFEALLMSRPEVQREEKWAWLWNARSQGGVWYRWRLWEIFTGSAQARSKNRYLPLFEGGHAWKTPDEQLPFEYATELDELVSDPDYASSDDDDLDEDGNREGQGKQEEKAFLNPLKKAKLVHLLARLPPTISRLRKGDIARVTMFAIANASGGAEEVVDLILSNAEQPFSLTSANGERKTDSKDIQQPLTGGEEAAASEGPDISAASLVGLYVVSDILSSSSTTNVRHGWRYRTLLETALLQRKTFEHLGLMAERLKWGRLRAEKWKRSVHLVLNLWEGWCSFATDVHEKLVQSFDNPPSAAAKAEGQGEDGEAEEEETLGKKKWKLVDVGTPQDGQDGEPGNQPVEGHDDDVDGVPMDEDDVEGEPIEDDDVEGEPMDEDDIDGEPMDEDEAVDEPNPQRQSSAGEAQEESSRKSQAEATTGQGESKGRGPRQRMRAVDMFADDDSDKV